MADDALLSKLCSICNVAPFKYKCPGCSAQTCSLPCYKRHQQWAQCSGKRDPAKYVKKSLLETPAMIDHDFNFLTSIERGLQKAERVESATSSGSASALQHQHGASRRKISPQQLAAAGVMVIRAPQGLSRQKQNNTHRGKSGHIIWTTEWIRGEDSHIITECSEVETLQRLDPFRSSRKRKRAAAASNYVITPDEPARPQEDMQQSEPGPNEECRLPPPAGPGQHSADDAVVIANNSNNSITSDGAISPPSSIVKVAIKDPPSPDLHGGIAPKQAFYLLRPRTSCTRTVLIPLSPNATLADSLRGKTILEFPTIYIFPEATTPPDDVFMMEDAYVQQERDEQAELEDALKAVDPETLRALEKSGEGADKGEEEGDIDGSKILDMLKRDLGAKAEGL